MQQAAGHCPIYDTGGNLMACRVTGLKDIGRYNGLEDIRHILCFNVCGLKIRAFGEAREAR